MVLDEDGDIEAFMELVASVLRERQTRRPPTRPRRCSVSPTASPADIRLFSARANGELLTGTFVFLSPVFSLSLYIAAAPAAGSCRPPRSAQLRDREALLGRWFDFGISYERDGSLNEGLARYRGVRSALVISIVMT